MAKRRRLRGKKLLVASAGLGAASALATAGCGESTELSADSGADAPADAPASDLPVANLVLPPDSGRMDAAKDAPMDAPGDAARDAPADAPPVDAPRRDAPVANLVLPPDASRGSGS